MYVVSFKKNLNGVVLNFIFQALILLHKCPNFTSNWNMLMICTNFTSLRLCKCVKRRSKVKNGAEKVNVCIFFFKFAYDGTK